MNKKIIFQILVLFVILLFTFLLFDQYSSNYTAKTIDTSQDIIYSNPESNSTNIINNIEYKSFDTIGNQYNIKAKSGTISDESPNLILMQDVESEIYFKDGKIFITALFATYNTINYDTIFKDKINIKYGEHQLNSNNANLFFKDHRIELYDNINYTNLNSSLLADEIEIDLLTRDLKVYMRNENKKVKAIFKNNVPN
tara:strand:- start:715 stop:1308 length:594 start_codon:yes stop_codon:yes gene_type:complete